MTRNLSSFSNHAFSSTVVRLLDADRDGDGDQEDGDETYIREPHGLRMRRTEQRPDA